MCTLKRILRYLKYLKELLVAKLTLTDVGSGYDLTPINNNFTAIENELQNNVLYRNNPVGEPNQMENDLDMNSNNLINVNQLNGEDVSALTGNLTTVANLSTEINTVAGISADVTTVAGDSADIQTVSASIANVNSVAGSISNVNSVAGSLSDVNTVATNVSAVTNVSNNINDVNSFAQLYLGSKSSDPTLDNDGNALVDGALYFNTVANGGNGELRVYDLTGATWKVAAFSATAANGVTYNNATSGLAATEVQSALDEIDGDLDAHLASSTAHDAAEITYDNTTSGLTATNTQAAVDEINSLLNYQETTAVLDNDFTFGTLRIIRLGNLVSIGMTDGASGAVHISDALPTSTDGLIPSWARPASIMELPFYHDSGTIFLAGVTETGRFQCRYIDSAGTAVTRTGTLRIPQITYLVAP